MTRSALTLSPAHLYYQRIIKIQKLFHLFANFYPVSLPPGIKLLDKLRALFITGVAGTCRHYNKDKTL